MSIGSSGDLKEGGRKVIVRRSADGLVTDITPAGFNARTRVHEYGGGDYAVSNGIIIFFEFYRSTPLCPTTGVGT